MMAFLNAFCVFGDGENDQNKNQLLETMRKNMITTDVRSVEQELISDSTHIGAVCTNWDDIRDTYHVGMLMEGDLAPKTQLNHTLQNCCKNLLLKGSNNKKNKTTIKQTTHPKTQINTWTHSIIPPPYNTSPPKKTVNYL